MSPEFTHPHGVSQIVQMKAIGDKKVVAQRAIGMMLHVPKVHPVGAVVHGHQTQLSVEGEVR